MTKRLTEKQLAAIEYLAQPNRGGLTYEEIAERVGVSDRTLRNWRDDETFYKALTSRIVKRTAGDLPRVLENVPDMILRDANAAMLRTYLQLHGLLTEKTEDVTQRQDGSAIDIDALKARLQAHDS